MIAGNPIQQFVHIALNPLMLFELDERRQLSEKCLEKGPVNLDLEDKSKIAHRIAGFIEDNYSHFFEEAYVETTVMGLGAIKLYCTQLKPAEEVIRIDAKIQELLQKLPGSITPSPKLKRKQKEPEILQELVGNYSEIRNTFHKTPQMLGISGKEAVEFLCNHGRNVKGLCVNLEGCEDIEDRDIIELVKSCPNIVSLNLSLVKNLSADSIECVAKCEKLHTLNLSKTNATDVWLRMLSMCRALKHLCLDNCPLISDKGLQYLKDCRKLKSLSLANCTAITDMGINHLTKIATLMFLNLQNCTPLTDLAFSNFKRMEKLRKVQVGGCSQLTDRAIFDMAKARTLTYMGIAKTLVSDAGLFFLGKLPLLESLNLEGCHRITERGLAYLEKCQSLRELNLTNCSQFCPYTKIPASIGALHNIKALIIGDVISMPLEHQKALFEACSTLCEIHLHDSQLVRTQKDVMLSYALE